MRGHWNLNDLEHPQEIQQVLRLTKTPIHLYQYMPHSFLIEQIYNISMSTIKPHCAVCVLVEKEQKVHQSWYQDLSRIRLPPSSQVSISTITYIGKLLKDQQHLGSFEFGTSSSNLLVCKECKICVHEGMFSF